MLIPFGLEVCFRKIPLLGTPNSSVFGEILTQRINSFFNYCDRDAEGTGSVGAGHVQWLQTEA
jgi:hypothetical protein